MKQNLNIEKGEVVVATKGEYSDFGLDGFFVAIQNIDLAAQAQIYTKRVKEEYEGSTYGFIAYLIAKELVIPVRYREIFIGSYGDFDPDFGANNE